RRHGQKRRGVGDPSRLSLDKFQELSHDARCSGEGRKRDCGASPTSDGVRSQWRLSSQGAWGRHITWERGSQMKVKPFAALAALAAVAAALVVALPANAAGNAGSTQISNMDPTGAVFTCPDTNYTVLGGTLHFILHDSIAADGSEHLTGTNTPIGV